MSEMPPVKPLENRPPRRRSASSTPNPMGVEPSKKRRRRNRVTVTAALIVFAAALVLIVIVSPKQATGRATYSVGTESGLVGDTAGGVSSYYQGLVISEIMSANATSVPDENGEYPDWIEIWNSSDHAIDLYGVGLSDSGDAIMFLFPEMTIGADERIIVFCSDTNQTATNKPLHAKFKLSSNGETVYMFTPNAYLIDSVSYRIMGSDTSWARLPDGSWAETTSFSPGYPNTDEGHLAYISATMVTAGAIIINEIMPDPVSGLTDEDGEFVDWIELYNTTDKTISLDNYALSNKENKPLKWRFPEGAVIAPHGYYLVYCSGKDRRESVTSAPHTNFKISAEHDTIILSNSHGRLVDRVVIDNIPEDCSYGRNEAGNFEIMQVATPTLPNNQNSAWVMDRYLREWNDSGVYISEVLASNDTVALAGSSLLCDWIELYNSSSATVDLSGYGLSNNLGRPRKWQFPAGTTIAPGQYLIVYCDGRNASSTAGELHTSFSISRLGYETICLSDPTGRILDKLMLPEMRTDVSYGRSPNLTGFFYYDTPTPTVVNGVGFRGYAEAPSFTVASGLYTSAVDVQFNVPAGTTVYYTTDGSVPTRSSILYTGEPITVNRVAVIRARAFPDDANLEPSSMISGSYFVNIYHSLPVVSLICDPDILWNEETGMFVAGDNIDKSGGIPFKNAIYRTYGKIPQEGYLEYYKLDGTQVISQGVEFSLQGQYSLDMPQKTLKIRAKASLGSKYFDAALFDDRPYTEYKSLVLRNSGNDCAWTRLLDGFQSRMLDAYGATVAHQAWNPVVVYINGVYWGHYNMRERVDQYFVAQHEGLSLEEAKGVTILEASGALKSGSNTVRREWRDMISRLKESSLVNDPELMQLVQDSVDIDNYLEYMALVMFVGDSDIGNIRWYKTSEEGSKWKWIFYDKDYGMYSYRFNSPYSYTKPKGMGEKLIDNTLFLKLLEVPAYKDQFLRKLGDVFQFFTTEKLTEILEPLVAQIQPEMSLHFARWAEEHDQKILSEWPTNASAAYTYWERRITRLYNTFKGRPNYLWGFVQEAFGLSDAEMLSYFGPRPELPSDFNP